MAAEFQIAPVHVVGRYALYDEIATGGMATVHFGRLRGAAGFARTVAIKRLHPQFARNAEFVSMFVDEARLAARIRHPHVVQTIDVVARDGELFLVMEYVQGESLSRLMRLLHAQRQRMPSRIVSGIMTGVLAGLHTAHETRDEHGRELGLVHRDVSPQNILVGADGLARVLDFGIARARGRVHTSQVGKLKGKLAYMSPEQVDNGAVSRQADVFSASIVLWELLTGKRLFHADNSGAVIAKILSGTVPPPSSVAPDIPPLYDAVVMKGLARDPADRYATAREMASALEACNGSEPISQIAVWVERVAGELLSRRADKVAQLEAGSEVSEISELRALVDELASGVGHTLPPGSSSSVRTREPVEPAAPAAQPVPEPPAVPRRRPLLWLSLLALVLGGAAALVFVNSRGARAGESPPAAAPPPAADRAAVGPRPPEAKQPAPEPAPSPVVAAPAPADSASAAAGTDAEAAPEPKNAAPVRRRSGTKRPAAPSTKKPASPFSDLGGRQ